MNKLKVLLVDDHAIIREGLKSLLSSHDDMKVVGEASNGTEAIEKTESCAPDVIVMDISMPGMQGTEATEAIKKAHPEVKVLALSMHEDRSYLRCLLDAGASGYVLKRSAPQDLVRALQHVASGGTYLDPAMAGKLIDGLLNKTPVPGNAKVNELSERETEVLRLIATGHSNKEAANILGISIKTVETYKVRAVEKLGLQSRIDIVRYASVKGWLQEL